MIHCPSSFILASGSPRRQELLKHFGFPFQIILPTLEEKAEGSIEEIVLSLAKQKGEEVFNNHSDSFVLSADTLVGIDGEVLGKPQDENHAKIMLQKLSDNWHQVYTGVVLHCPNGEVLTDVNKTDVHFMPLSLDIIRKYIQSKEPMDKAGAYGMQEMGGSFVKEIHGSPSNVIGLPLHVCMSFFTKLGWV